MDRVIVDSSVVVKWLVPEPLSTEARRVLTAYQAGTLELLAPDLLNAEVGNILWKKQRFHGLAPTDAQLLVDAFRALPIALTPTADLLDAAYRLAVAHQRTVYGAHVHRIKHARELPDGDGGRAVGPRRLGRVPASHLGA